MFYADLHIHGRYSGGASPKMELHEIERVARQKGINVMGTGDCFHPVWMDWIEEMEEDLDTGLLQCRRSGTLFLPTVEVSCERGRKVMHMLLLFPNMQMVHKIRGRLEQYGNLDKEGRPSLKLTPGELMDVVKSKFDDVLMVAAHILSPWTGILGDKNHYESIFEVMDVLPDAVETGLPADKGMVSSIRELAKVPLLSFSDAHSLPNIGREVTVFEGDPSWDNIVGQIRANKTDTIEFPPPLGKYHRSGHKHCGYSVGIDGKPICPVCHKRITMGVEQRVADLGGNDGDKNETYMIPLRSIISMCTTLNTEAIYNSFILNHVEIPMLVSQDLNPVPMDDWIREAIFLTRNKQMGIIPGYDGRFGTIVHLYDMLKKKLNKSNELFMSKKDHEKAFDEAGRINNLMMSGKMTITQEEYEELYE